YDYALGDAEGNSVNKLTDARPWYSRYAEEVFRSPVLGGDLLHFADVGSEEIGHGHHLLGMRHYELTNHLGNVQATVLDRVSPILDPSGTLEGYHAELSGAQDHYPFGMLMPGRYISDTAEHCVLLHTTVLVPHYQWQIYKGGDVLFAHVYGPGNPIDPGSMDWALEPGLEPLHLFHMNDISTHPDGEVVVSGLEDSITVYDISLSGEPSGGVMGYFLLHPDPGQSHYPVNLDMDLPEDVYMDYRVRQ